VAPVDAQHTYPAEVGTLAMVDHNWLKRFLVAVVIEDGQGVRIPKSERNSLLALRIRRQLG